MSNFSEEGIDAILKEHPVQQLTPHTVRDAVALKQVLNRVRTRGYAVDNGNDSMGMRCVVAPILNAAGEVGAATCVSDPAERVPHRRERELAHSLTEACGKVSTMLKYATVQTKPSMARER
ncbi:MAG: IclR family transcriptional regulator C-terminal domain-containing protein [Acidobacteria bacterium]|nr:IclR family transcriptional regulator C-terminal domain-containing protein [Acidobacteriota bacterium]